MDLMKYSPFYFWYTTRSYKKSAFVQSLTLLGLDLREESTSSAAWKKKIAEFNFLTNKSSRGTFIWLWKKEQLVPHTLIKCEIFDS